MYHPEEFTGAEQGSDGILFFYGQRRTFFSFNPNHSVNNCERINGDCQFRKLKSANEVTLSWQHYQTTYENESRICDCCTNTYCWTTWLKLWLLAAEFRSRVRVTRLRAAQWPPSDKGAQSRRPATRTGYDSMSVVVRS